VFPQVQQISRSDKNVNWFALRVRSNFERVALMHLRERGFEEFSPSYTAERQWSDRKKIIERFLFPGYVFSRFNPDNRRPVLTVPGVVNLVSFGDKPCPIPDEEILSIQRMTQSGLLVTPYPFLSKGQIVILERGPLTGLQGIVQEVKGALRLVVSISILQRSVSVEVDRTWVRLIQGSDTRARLTNGAWVQMQPARIE